MLLGQAVRDELSIVIRFMIKERNRANRQHIISTVNGWAGEGWLQVSTRPGKRLYVTCIQPANSAAFAWNEDMTLTFAACGDPYWQDVFPIKAPVSGNSGSAEIHPIGTRPCVLEADITNAGDSAVTSLSLTANGKTISFANLRLSKGKTLKLYYDERHILRATVDGNGVLSYRTPASADDIQLIPAQANTIQFDANGTCNAVLYARGRYD